MKTSILLFLLISLCTYNGYTQHIIEHPSYQFRNTGIYKVNRIELSDQATRVQLISEFIPGWWVKFSKAEIYLEVPETGKKYQAIEVEGIQWDQAKPTPKTGVDTFIFTFPPLPKQTKTVNWMDNKPCIWGIALCQETDQAKSFISEISGNWISTDGNNRWTYGFYKDFVIADNQFWTYESIQKKGKNLIVNLKSDQTQSQLILTLQKDGTCKIGPTKTLQSIYQPENNLLESTSDTATQLDKQFFQPGSKAHIQGYICGYDPHANFKSGLIYCNNPTTDEDFPTVVELSADGRFSVDIPLDYPTYNNIIFGNQSLPFYAEPGDTLTIFIAWEDWLLADRYRNQNFTNFRTIRFMGPLSKFNTDLTKIFAHIQHEGNIQFEKLAYILTPQAFKDRALKLLDQKLHTLDTLDQKFHFASKSRHIAEATIKNNIAEYILDFDMTRKYFKSEKPNKVLDTPVTAEYYDYLQQMPLNDPYLIISSYSWTFFNRFEYAAPFEKVYSHPDAQNLDPIKRTTTLWRLKDSIYTNYFKLTPTFCYEVIKLRELANELQNSTSFEQSNSSAQITLQGISHPYLRLKAAQLLEKYATKHLSVATALPDTKSAAIFRKLIEPYQGKVIFVDFWSTGCGPCRSGIKAMAPMREKYEGKNIVFLFITDEKSSPLKPYNDFMSDVKGEKLRIPENDYNYLRELFKFNAIPHYETINKKGEVVNLQAYKNLNQENIFDLLLKE